MHGEEVQDETETTLGRDHRELRKIPLTLVSWRVLPKSIRNHIRRIGRERLHGLEVLHPLTRRCHLGNNTIALTALGTGVLMRNDALINRGIGGTSKLRLVTSVGKYWRVLPSMIST
jgi:hypothetical protein